eukprot:TRINITY_DN25858_c0_g1_i2.p1 TRINITY_DN25858_c0_g1~~TRINITY_DN25858_c0_g1_i2.p1  ORF type:complete len:521 (-),score=65.45 TRINITY_DN25858_c0_g1_i2:64-1626(-)
MPRPPLRHTGSGGLGAADGASSTAVATRVACTAAMLRELRDEFRRCGGTDDRGISATDLARYWKADLANTHGSLTDTDSLVVDAYIAEAFSRMSLSDSSRASMEEFVHYYMLRGHVHHADKINSRLKKVLKQEPQVLWELQLAFGCLEASGRFLADNGPKKQLIERTDHDRSLAPPPPLTDKASTALWSVAPKCLRKSLTNMTPAQRAEELVDGATVAASAAATADNVGHVAYPWFLAHCVGRRRSEVSIHLYDISSGAAERLSRFVVGHVVDGIWHTGVVAFGREYYFSGLAEADDPGHTKFGKPVRVIHHGWTWLEQDELHTFICDELKPSFNRHSYDLLSRNCNHFAEKIVHFLCGKGLPAEVMSQPDLIGSLGIVEHLLKPLLKWYFRDPLPAKPIPSGSPEMEKSPRLKDRCALGDVVLVHSEKGDGDFKVGVLCEDMRLRGFTAESCSAKSAMQSNAWASACATANPCGTGTSTVTVDLVPVLHFDLHWPSSKTPGRRNGRICADLVPRSDAAA